MVLRFQEKLRVEPILGGIVDGVAKHIKHAAVDITALNRALPFVELKRVLAYQIGYTLDSEAAKVGAVARADPGDLLKGVWSCHYAISFEQIKCRILGSLRSGSNLYLLQTSAHQRI